jgi:hypothetical protein
MGWTWKVVGLQYYHIARIVLAVSNHQSPTPGYENLRHARKIEVRPRFSRRLPSLSTNTLRARMEKRTASHPSLQKTVRNHLLIILGLAASNKTAANTLFTARHALSVCKSPIVFCRPSSPLLLIIPTLIRGRRPPRRTGTRRDSRLPGGYGKDDRVEDRATDSVVEGAVG